MTDYLLDTNHLSPIVTIEHPLRQKIITQLQAGDTFVAIRNDLILLTNDKDFGAIVELKRENWR